MKKLLCLLTAMLVLMLLIGCDNNNDIPDVTPGNGANVNDKTEKPSDGQNNDEQTTEPESKPEVITTVDEDTWYYEVDEYSSKAMKLSYTTDGNGIDAEIYDDTAHVTVNQNSKITEIYTQKLLNGTYATFVKQVEGEEADHFVLVLDTSDYWFNLLKTSILHIELKELYTSFEYNEETSVYKNKEPISASYYNIASPENAKEDVFNSLTLKFENEKLASLSIEKGELSIVYSDIGSTVVSIPEEVIENAITEVDILLDTSDASLEIGKTLNLNATVAPTSLKDEPLVWTSSDESVATVDANGVVTAVSPGTATITVAIDAGTGASDSCNITVSYPPVIPPEGTPTYSYTWEKTKIIYELTNNTQSDELTSGCARYYAGTANEFSEIDIDVRNRNLTAAKQANIDVEFTYVGDTDQYGWGANISRIVTAAKSTDSNSPDIYCNFVYDLTCAQLRGCFANLKDTNYANGNFFRFNDADYNGKITDYFDAKAGEGYLYEYMESLSLSDDKMYILASDYTIDVMRAALVIPVNIEMLNSISLSDSWTGDMQSYADFYDLVWRSEEKIVLNEKYTTGWTYDVLAHYAQKVYHEQNGSDSALDDIMGFMAGRTIGIAADALIYSSGVKIINKTSNGDGTYTYTYPENNSDFLNLTDALSNLFMNTSGVISVTSSEAIAYDSTARNELQMIRNKFAQNEVLFGGIVLLSSLVDDNVYQNMAVYGKGFGILPVPGYKEGDEYHTTIHNLARVVAIAKASTEFSQCSAYLDCLSRTSSEILQSYFEPQVGGLAAAENSLMITYIRNHITDCFDKTFEDAVINKYEAQEGSIDAFASKWTEIIGNKNGFIYTAFEHDYKSIIISKLQYLNDVIEEWNTNT